MASLAAIMRAWQSDVWSQWFDSAVDSLAGYQSLMSLLQAIVDSSTMKMSLLGAGADVPGQGLHFPATTTLVLNVDGSMTLTWSTELGTNGNANDPVWVPITGVSQIEGNTPFRPAFFDNSKVRSDGTITLFPPTGKWQDWEGFLLYFWIGAFDPATQPARTTINLRRIES